MSDKPENINWEKIKSHWIESSDSNLITMEHLFETKDYSWSLFVGHLVIEKLLKACFVSMKNDYPPLTHNLIRLAELSEIKLNEEATEVFATVTTFNINARYEDYKENFNKICTKEFTEFWLSKIKEYRQWIKTQHLK